MISAYLRLQCPHSLHSIIMENGELKPNAPEGRQEGRVIIPGRESLLPALKLSGAEDTERNQREGREGASTHKALARRSAIREGELSPPLADPFLTQLPGRDAPRLPRDLLLLASPRLLLG